MARLTINIDHGLLERARMRALEDGVSVNALVRPYPERYAGCGDADVGLNGFGRLARRSTVSSGPVCRTWTRDELDDRAGLRWHQCRGLRHRCRGPGQAGSCSDVGLASTEWRRRGTPVLVSSSDRPAAALGATEAALRRLAQAGL